MIKVGDFVKGISDKYNITNKDMTRGVVKAVTDDSKTITVKVLEHTFGSKGTFDVDADCFEVIGHVKEFNREEVLELLKNGCKKALLDYDLSGANLSDANLSGANLSDADLSGANLSGANLDFSCYPLWCGGLHVKTDKRLACQLAYHLCSMQCDDEEYIKMRNSILGFANQFHRVDECGVLEEVKTNEQP